MWFNSMQCEKPYLPLICQEFCRDVEVVFKDCPRTAFYRQRGFVSILIFLEVVFKVFRQLTGPGTHLGFNPYFSGSGV